MGALPFGPKDIAAMREAAAELVARLGLRGYDNVSITAVDAWIDSPEFQEDFRGGSVKLAYLAGAYLGEAVIRRHGGRWVAGPNAPSIAINRNGFNLVNPFGKVQKRATLGPTENLLALVNLVEHVTARPPSARTPENATSTKSGSTRRRSRKFAPSLRKTSRAPAVVTSAMTASGRRTLGRRPGRDRRRERGIAQGPMVTDGKWSPSSRRQHASGPTQLLVRPEPPEAVRKRRARTQLLVRPEPPKAVRKRRARTQLRACCRAS
jgi:hypothetical protein